ncbi:glycosyltransferase [Thalassotalea litorea]|uniref:glycosyltransferase n=1 Tax=Thalassotalea litorea TaxID=2020715 RepID=UPI0037359D01
MILVTVGTQLPFERLIKAVDEFADRHKDIQTFGQIGESTYIPRHFQSKPFLAKSEYEEKFKRANVIVSHAGMGSIISALTNKKPIIILPRLASLGEHRNEHQMATCEKFRDIEGCYVADSPAELIAILEDLDSIQGGSISDYASDSLIQSIEDYIGD